MEDWQMYERLGEILRVLEDIREKLPGPLVPFTVPHQPDLGKCPSCGKKRGGLSIPRMGIYEADRCMCPTATSQADGGSERG